MSTTNVFYPEFVPNQVLTSSQLNDLREHLDEQDRTARVRLVGTGRVCGLEWERETDRIRIHEGFGVTSDGYLIQLEETEFTHYRTYEDPDMDEDEEPKDPHYQPWSVPGDPRGQISLLELVTSSDDGATAFSSLPAQDESRVLVLYLEKKPIEQVSCLVTDCDNKGLNVQLSLRVLLVPRDALDVETGCGPAPTMVRIPRLGTEVNLGGVTSTTDLDDGYAKIIADAFDASGLGSGIQTLFDDHKLMLGIDDADASVIAGLRTGLESNAPTGAARQYHYDALLDMVDARNEAVTALCGLLGECCPVLDYPRHLMIGALDGTEGYVNEFRPSPVRNVVDGDLERVRKLFLRMVALVSDLDFDAGSEIRLTPSHTRRRALGEGAVPYHYPLSAEISAYWQPALCCTTAPLWSWHGTPAKDLAVDYHASSLVRIENVLGHDMKFAEQEIATIRKALNVEFSIVRTYLDDPFAGEKAHRVKTAEQVDSWRDEIRGLTREAAKVGRKPEEEAVKKLAEMVDKVAEKREELTGRMKDLVELTRDHGLICDHSDREADYLLLRSEIHCVFGEAMGHLLKVATTFAKGSEQDPAVLARLRQVTEGGRTSLYAAAARAVSAGAAGKFGILELGTLPDESVVPASGVITALWLRELIPSFLAEALPHRLAEFDYALYSLRLQEILDLLYRLLLSLETIDLVFGDASREGRIPTLLVGPDEAEHARAALWSLARHCGRTRLNTLAGADAAAKDADLSHFGSLAGAVDGLEHLAGVEKGGTFILVSDGKPDDGKVVADFSLSGKLPCCCRTDLGSLCLPPVARADYRIVTVPSEKQEDALRLDIEVLANDHDPSLHAPHGDPGVLTIELDLPQDEEKNFLSELGGRVSVEGDQIRYEHDAPPPGAIDRFEYDVVRKHKDCDGRDTGQVLILFLPEVEAGNARIAGTVLNPDREGPANDAAVELLPSGEVDFTDQNGTFRFEDLPPDTYTLQAKKDTLVSDVETVVVGPGDDIPDVELVLRKDSDPGSLKVEVTHAETGKAIFNAALTLLTTGEKTFTNEEGVGEFPSLAAGNHSVGVSASGFQSTQVTVAIESGKAASIAVGLSPSSQGGRFHLNNSFIAVAESSSGNSRKEIEDFYDHRYRENLKAVAAGHSPLDRVDPSRTKAIEFLSKNVAGESDSTSRIVSGYGKVISELAEEEASVEVMEAVTRATYDRIAVTSGSTGLSANDAKALAKTREVLVESGVDMVGLRNDWGGSQLSETHGMKSFADLDQILAG